MSEGPPSFLESFFESLKMGEEKYWYISYLPWLFIVLCVAPPVLINNTILDYKGEISTSDNSVILSAFAVVGGFLGAFTISAITQIQILVTKYPFSEFLKEAKIFNQFIYIPQYIFLVQIVFVISCSTLMIFSILFSSFRFNILIFSTGFLFYTAIKTWKLVDLIRLLTWHNGDYFVKNHKDEDGS